MRPQHEVLEFGFCPDDDEEANGDSLDFSEISEGYSIRTMQLPSTFWGPDSDPALFKRGMFGKNGRLLRIGQLLREGKSLRKIRAETGASKNTIVKLRRVLEKVIGLRVICECGLPVTHKGWCSYRFKLSPARQNFIKNWHAK